MSMRQIRKQLSEIVLLLEERDQGALRPFGLSLMAFRVLQRLSVGQGMRLVDLARRLLVDSSTITRMIDRLEQAGLVARMADPTDRRAQRAVLTSAGRERYQQAMVAHERTGLQQLGSLSSAEQAQLIDLLAKLQRSLLAESPAPAH